MTPNLEAGKVYPYDNFVELLRQDIEAHIAQAFVAVPVSVLLNLTGETVQNHIPVLETEQPPISNITEYRVETSSEENIQAALNLIKEHIPRCYKPHETSLRVEHVLSGYPLTGYNRPEDPASLATLKWWRKSRKHFLDEAEKCMHMLDRVEERREFVKRLCYLIMIHN